MPCAFWKEEINQGSEVFALKMHNGDLVCQVLVPSAARKRTFKELDFKGMF